ncbi:ABC transporter permease [Thermostichus vulcanus]|uniref:ABC transporter permease n=1 Tax=Thermostichus vulcanus str. 'Rupite' TaxID=2813851 RepID=A0ABT0CAY5_THEVL|nr:ABC transporter permease [Thermostichus vulcanus]MCJ2542879.1 ABC transporter permease [Thermostichus vulcanus str. 'Rupite']
MKKSFDQFLNTKAASIILPAATIILSIVLWQVGVRLFNVPRFILPAPTEIIAAMNQWSQVIMRHSLITVGSTVLAFTLALVGGVLLGSIIGSSRLAYLSLYPLLVGFNTIPKVALVPLLAIWFGLGLIPAVITAFLLAFFPIAVNVAVGLETVETEMRDVLRSLGASAWEIFIKVGLPHSMPYLFASLKVSISSAFVGSVISETVASNGGLGYLIVSASSSFDVPLAFAGLIALGIMGILLYTFFAALERYVLAWRQ